MALSPAIEDIQQLLKQWAASTQPTESEEIVSSVGSPGIWSSRYHVDDVFPSFGTVFGLEHRDSVTPRTGRTVDNGIIRDNIQACPFFCFSRQQARVIRGNYRFFPEPVIRFVISKSIWLHPGAKWELGIAEDTLVSAEKSTTSWSLSGFGYEVKLKAIMYQLGCSDLDW